MIATVACLNKDCGLYDVEETARATFERGVYFLTDDARCNCEECGEAVTVLGAELTL